MALRSSVLCDHVTSVMTNSLGYYLLFEVRRLGRGSYTILDTTSGSWGVLCMGWCQYWIVNYVTVSKRCPKTLLGVNRPFKNQSVFHQNQFGKDLGKQS